MVRRSAELARSLPNAAYPTLPGRAHLPYLEAPDEVAALYQPEPPELQAALVSSVATLVAQGSSDATTRPDGSSSSNATVPTVRGHCSTCLRLSHISAVARRGPFRSD